jgi:TonB family protein
MGNVQESPPLAAGTLLDGYEIAEVLDQGRFGFTYRAYDPGRSEVVIKEFLPQEFAVRDNGTVHARDAEDKTPLRFWLRSFLDKAVLLQKLNHPGLTRVLRQFEANGTGYYVAEYIPGETLAAIVERQQTLSEAQLRRLLSPVLSGLEQAHAVNLLHRDIRPENLLVRPDDSAVLINFGDLRAPIRFKSRTIFSSGMAPYAAPEEFYMAGPHGAWTDIYALGALAYRTVCGVPPPDARSRASGTAMTPVAQAARVRCSESFLAAIEQALMASAEHRLQTVGALRAAMQGEGGEALPAAGPRAASSPAIPAALPAQKERRGRSPLPFVLGGVALAAAAGAFFWLRTPSTPAAAPVAASDVATTAAPAGSAAATTAPAGSAASAAPTEDAGLDRLAQDMMAKEKKASEAKQELQALQQQREQQAAQEAKNAAKNSGTATAAATPAAPPAPSQAELDAAAHAKQLEDELAKLRAEKEAEEKARAAAAVATAAPATSSTAAAAPRETWNAWYCNARGEVKSNLHYPRASLQAGEEGDVTVKVLLRRDGSVVRVSTVQRSDYPALDNEALAVFSRIGHFPPVPADYSPNSSEVEFSMPINFRVE